MKLIKLKNYRKNANPFYINPKNITSIQDCSTNDQTIVCIAFIGGGHASVGETLEDVIRYIEMV